MLDLSELPRPVIRYGAGIWRRRWLIVGIAWLVALLGWAAVSTLPDKYQSQAHVFIQEAAVDPLISSGPLPNYERRVEVLSVSLLTFPNVEEMVYRAGLDARIEAVSPLDRQAQLERLVKAVQGGIRIVSPREMYFVLRYSHESPEDAKNVLDAAVNILIEQDLGASLRENEASEQRLNTTIEELNVQLAAQEQELAEYRRIHATELASSVGDEQVRSRKQTQLNEILDTISQTSFRVETLRARLATTPKLSTGGELEQLKVQLSQLRSQYNDNYPDIQNILQRIERLESDNALPENPDYIRLQAELRSAQDTLRALRVREERVRTEIEGDVVNVGQAPAVISEYLRLQRNVADTQTRLDEVKTRRNALALRRTVNNDGQGLEYLVLERPRKALVPNDPPRQLLILAVFVLAFGAGGGLALVMTFLERTYTQSADLEEAFDLPVLGAIGKVATPQSRRRQRFDFLRLTLACVVLLGACFAYIYVAVLHPQATLLKKGGDVTTTLSDNRDLGRDTTGEVR